LADNPNPSYHNGRWYKNHPEAQRPTKNHSVEPPESGTSTPSLIPFLRFIGLVFILGGFTLMTVPTLYWYGVPMVWAGFTALMLEVCTDPAFRKRHYSVRVALVIVCVCVCGLFTYRFVLVEGGINPTAHAMLRGQYPPGTEIAGIGWDGHLTDLRVVIFNPTDDDYHDVDLTIRPDVSTYKAAKLDVPSNCDLKKIPGGNILGYATAQGGKPTVRWDPQSDEIHDDMGDVFTTVLTDAGYRLICSSFPSHSNIQLVFAVGTISPAHRTQVHNLASGQKVMELLEMRPSSPFAMFAPRPSPRSGSVDSKYTRRFKPFVDKQTIDVSDGS
jgi:hypothetical protein